MRVIETLTDQQKIELITGNAVGFFPYMVLNTDEFYSKLNELCIGYYMTRSGYKTVSPMYNRLKALADTPNALTVDELIGRFIRAKYIEKWNKVYNLLIIQEYDALNNIDYRETKIGNNSNTDTYDSVRSRDGDNSTTDTYNTEFAKTGDNTITDTYDSEVAKTGDNTITDTHDTQLTKTGDNSDTITHDTTKTNSGNNENKVTHDTSKAKTGTNTDNTTYDVSTEDNGNTGSHEVTSRNQENSDDVYGFNSEAPVGDTYSNEQSSETVVGDYDKNKTHNLNTKTGTENKEFGINETEVITGTDTTTITVDESEKYTGTESKNIVISETEKHTGTDIKTEDISESEKHTGTDTKAETISETEKHTGTDSSAVKISESETHTGTDKKDIKIDETITKNGRWYGNPTEAVREEIEMRIMLNFMDIMYADIDSVFTCPLYE